MHQAAWPSQDDRPEGSADRLGAASDALIAIRNSKTDKKLSMKAEISIMALLGPAVLSQAQRDLAAVGRLATLNLEQADKVAISSMEFAEQQ